MTGLTATATIWSDATPGEATVDGDGESVELGLRFTPTVAGEIRGIRFWKTAENTGTHVGSLWSSTGKRLASAKFTKESKSGWQTVTFAKPVDVAADKTYVASYLAPKGGYASTVDYDSRAASTDLITLPSRAGVYSYGTERSFPSETWESSVYWVDVLFAPQNAPSERTPATTEPEQDDPAPADPAPSTPTTAPAPSGPSAGTTSSAFANASNTGPQAAGFAPTVPYTGPMTITQPGTVVQNQIIPAGLRVEADNVTIQGNLIVGATDVTWDDPALYVEGSNAKVLDNEIRGESATDWRKTPVNGVKLYGDDVQFERNNVHQIAGDGITLDAANARVIGNWVHDFVVRTDGAHYDGLHYPIDSISSPGLIKDNTVELWIMNAGSSGMTASLAFPDHAPKLVVEHNLIAGGGYGIMGGSDGITFKDNVFWTKFSPNVGEYGPVAHVGKYGTITWTGNRYTDDGVTTRGIVRY
ncbi:MULTISPECIES: DUF4082 domain-containing protein [unclassified Diaminobutyricimonas]|uniref:DUF4082 domain-containing protein n=1 Tax=unclassified Diaminobutyricimonas TaxID=2643261 RepID=UPI00142178C0|nr:MULTISPECIES: DUF4082 domain-containing protein [unclassified Diaminobutyricimonas]